MSSVGKKKDVRKKNYRIPSSRDRKTGKAVFPTMETLFNTTMAILKDLIQEDRDENLRDENLFDSEVARFIYPGYPYAHQFKRGLKNVSNVVELSLLSRNLGMPFQWVQSIRRGDLDFNAAISAYQKRKRGAALAAEAEYVGELGDLRITVRTRQHDSALLGDAYAAALGLLRPVVSERRAGRRQGAFI